MKTSTTQEISQIDLLMLFCILPNRGASASVESLTELKFQLASFELTVWPKTDRAADYYFGTEDYLGFHVPAHIYYAWCELVGHTGTHGS